MAIKPLEKKNNSGIFFKLIFLITLIATGIILDRFFLNKTKDIPSVLGKTEEFKQETIDQIENTVKNNDLIAESLKKTEAIGGEILGQSTNLVTDMAQKASSMASDLIYQTTIGKLVEQIDKLPIDQQERVREQICR